MILGTAETADVRTIFPQKRLQLLRIQAVRDLAEVHDADRAIRQRPAFTEDLDAFVLIQGQPFTRRRHHHEKLFGLWSQPEPPLQLLKPSSDCPHDFSVVR
jgi:hypothetical protein